MSFPQHRSWPWDQEISSGCTPAPFSLLRSAAKSRAAKRLVYPLWGRKWPCTTPRWDVGSTAATSHPPLPAKVSFLPAVQDSHWTQVGQLTNVQSQSLLPTKSRTPMSLRKLIPSSTDVRGASLLNCTSPHVCLPISTGSSLFFADAPFKS